MPRKRPHDEMTGSGTDEPKELSLLQKIRNMWEFANVYQFICIFGKALKIDEDFDIEDFENECLQPGYSEKLEEIGLQLLKWISSHRGLNYDIWDEYTRRQYQAKAPNQNPYGEDEEPKKFRHFDIFMKIRVLHQLTVWTFWNPDRIKQSMPEHQKESDQAEWRIEPIGWDEDEREYYVLDDNRLYRRTEPSIPEPEVPKAKPKYTSKKAQAARRKNRASKRRKIVEDSDGDTDMHNGEENDNETKSEEPESSILPTTEAETDPTKIDTYGGYSWECIAVTLDEYNTFLDSIKRTRDANQKTLRETLINNVIPEIERQAEKQQKKAERRQKELAVLERLATAKRSSRIADKADRERRDAEAAEAERQRALTLAEAHREQDRQKKMEQERLSRMMTREQRIREREYKRVLMEEQLARDAEEQKKIEEGEARGSFRQLKERIEKSKKELEELQEEDWTFDCSGCGKYGKNYDDGEHSVACEKCNVWQHSKCLGISKTAAEREDFHFVCRDCKRKEEEANRPKISLKFKLGSSSSPPQASSPPAPVQSPTHQKVTSTTGPTQRPQDYQPRQPPPGQATNGQFHPAQVPPRQHQISPQPPGFQLPQPWSTGYVNRPAPHQPPQPTQPQSHQPLPVNGYPGQHQFPATYQSQHHYPQYPQPTFYAPPQPQPQPQPQYHPPYQRSPQPTQQPNYHQQTPTAPSQRPPSSQSPPNTSFSSAQGRLPSPVVNRPTISPTQGNHDVGPIAGVPGSNNSSHRPGLSTPQSNGAQHRLLESHINGLQRSSSPQSSSQTSNSSNVPTRPMSGLSPVKQPSSSPLPPPSNIPQKLPVSRSPPNAGNVQPGGRTVSGTPIFPPSENLAPSPEQIRKSPVPTPSKQLPPAELEQAGQQQVGVSSNFGSASGAVQSSSPPIIAPVGQAPPRQQGQSQEQGQRQWPPSEQTRQ